MVDGLDAGAQSSKIRPKRNEWFRLVREGGVRSLANSTMLPMRCLRRLVMTCLGEFTYLRRRASVGPDRQVGAI